MVYFFYGENTYLIREKINKLKQRFSLEQGDLNISEKDGATLSRDEFSNLVFALPFLSSKRLVIIKNLLLDHSDNIFKKYVAESLDKIPETTVLIFVEYGFPDRKLTLFKTLDQPKTSQNFAPLTGRKLSDWIKEKVKESGVNITDDAIIDLQLFLGADLWRMENEIQKLSLYSRANGNNTINSSDINLLVDPILSPNIFDFISFLADGKKSSAIKILDQLIKAGENELKILSMIVYQYRTLLIVYDLGQKRLTSQEISKKAKLHPFVVKKSQNFLKKTSQQKLKQNYFALLEADLAIKKGQIDPKLALNLLVANF